MDPSLNNPDNRYAALKRLILEDPALTSHGGILGGSALLGAVDRILQGMGTPPDAVLTTPIVKPPSMDPGVPQPTNPTPEMPPNAPPGSTWVPRQRRGDMVTGGYWVGPDGKPLNI